MTKSVLVGEVQTNMSATATNMSCVTQMMNGDGWTTTTALADSVVSGPFVISNMRFDIATACGAAKSMVFTLMKNGAATAVTCTISGVSSLTATSAVGLTASFVAGDTICVQCAPSSTPTVSISTWYMDCDSVNPKESMFMFQGSHLWETFRHDYLAGGGNSVVVFNSTDCDYTMPFSGWLKNLYIKTTTSPGGSGYAISAMINGVASALTATVTATTANDTTHTVRFNAGDRVCFDASPLAGVTTCRGMVSCTIQSDIDGDSMIGYAPKSNYTILAGNTYWDSIGGQGRQTPTITESIVTQKLGNYSIKALYVTTRIAPGAGTSWEFMVRKARGQTGIKCVVSGTGTTGNSGNLPPERYTAGDYLSIQATPTGATATTSFSCGVCITDGSQLVANANLKPHPFQPGLAR